MLCVYGPTDIVPSLQLSCTKFWSLCVEPLLPPDPVPPIDCVLIYMSLRPRPATPCKNAPHVQFPLLDCIFYTALD